MYLSPNCTIRFSVIIQQFYNILMKLLTKSTQFDFDSFEIINL